MSESETRTGASGAPEEALDPEEMPGPYDAVDREGHTRDVDRPRAGARPTPTRSPRCATVRAAHPSARPWSSTPRPTRRHRKASAATRSTGASVSGPARRSRRRASDSPGTRTGLPATPRVGGPVRDPVGRPAHPTQLRDTSSMVTGAADSRSIVSPSSSERSSSGWSAGTTISIVWGRGSHPTSCGGS